MLTLKLVTYKHELVYVMEVHLKFRSFASVIQIGNSLF